MTWPRQTSVVRPSLPAQPIPLPHAMHQPPSTTNTQPHTTTQHRTSGAHQLPRASSIATRHVHCRSGQPFHRWTPATHRSAHRSARRRRSKRRAAPPSQWRAHPRLACNSAGGVRGAVCQVACSCRRDGPGSHHRQAGRLHRQQRHEGVEIQRLDAVQRGGTAAARQLGGGGRGTTNAACGATSLGEDGTKRRGDRCRGATSHRSGPVLAWSRRAVMQPQPHTATHRYTHTHTHIHTPQHRHSHTVTHPSMGTSTSTVT